MYSASDRPSGFDKFFVIVGAPKAGTTAMTRYLNLHPQVFMPQKKELHYFGGDLHKTDFYPKKLEEYLQWFESAPPDAICGEASVMYLYSKSAGREIKDFCPAAKIIIMLRDPVEVMYSLHSQLLYGGFENLRDFSAALDAEEERQRGKRIPEGAQLQESLFYRDIAKFCGQVERYFDVFGRDAVKVVVYDDFKRDAAAVYRDLLRFLGIDEGFAPDFSVVNANKKIRSKALRRFLDRCPKPLLPGGVRWRLDRFNTVYQKRPAMASGLERDLRREFAAEVSQLGRLLGRDLSHWSAGH